MVNGVSFLIIMVIAMSAFAFKDFGLFSKGNKGNTGGKGDMGAGSIMMMGGGDGWSSPSPSDDGGSQCK